MKILGERQSTVVAVSFGHMNMETPNIICHIEASIKNTIIISKYIEL